MYPRHSAFYVLVLWCAAEATAVACPFCSATSQTLSEELATAEVAVLVRLTEPAEPFDPATSPDSVDPDAGTATFEVVEFIRGEKKFPELKQLKVVYFGENDPNQLFLINGIDAGIPPANSTQVADWTTPLPLSKRGREYVKLLDTLPKKGAERLAFFQKYFEDEDPLLAQDAYDEFARAPYSEVIALGPQMDRGQLMEWINNSEVGPTRRRLYLTMLGVCGKPEDADQLETMLKYDFQQIQPALNTMVTVMGLQGSPLGAPIAAELVRADVRRQQQCLDALVAAYLKLKGPEGLPLINERFLANPDAEYTHVYATIMALRFHGEETDVLPKEQLLESMRLVLDNSEISDQVIPDLTRWEDWSILDRLNSMFEESEEDAWIRQPVISYMLTAAEQPGEVGERANAALEAMEDIDPKAVKRARNYQNFGMFARSFSEGAPTAGNNTDQANETTPTTKGNDSVSDRKPPRQRSPLSSARIPSQFTIITTPLVACLFLMGLYALLLRSGDVRTPSESQTE